MALRITAEFGRARNHRSWNSDDQRQLDIWLTEKGLDPSVVEAGMAKGAELNWDETIRELLK